MGEVATVILLDVEGVHSGILQPEEPEWTHPLNQYSTFNFDLSLDSHLAKKRYITPYITDFMFFIGNRLEMEGIVVGAELSDINSEFIKISCRSYLHYLELRYWPFDPQDPTRFNRSWYNQDVVVIIEDILDDVLSLGNSLDFSYSNAELGIPVNYRIEPADTDDIYSKIVQLSDQEPGFDFWVGKDRRLNIVRERGSEVDIQLTRANLSGFTWQYKGPRATHLLGLGAGTSSRLGISIDSANALQTIKRRYDKITDFGTVVDIDMLTNLTTAELDRLTHESEIVGATVQIDDFTKYVSPGDTIPFDIDLGVANLNSSSRIESISGKINLQGDQSYDIVFEADSDA